jgi:hypothetical protein
MEIRPLAQYSDVRTTQWQTFAACRGFVFWEPKLPQGTPYGAGSTGPRGRDGTSLALFLTKARSRSIEATD